ncbi:hypothetical protein [Agreia sp. VKM Ac-1783]|uniref:DUF7882 family protein n=1 Tax=Agreia sp. VKM Ac-1783 TaxID=1938889 RepID=UPI000A2ACF0B|nr:hypothetical protein SAMN06295943_3380 [Agreia sp. VKM Ac-1783]
MGKLIYGDAEIEIEFDDRALTHVQLVLGSKLRRGESFFFSWKDAVAAARAYCADREGADAAID